MGKIKKVCIIKIVILFLLICLIPINTCVNGSVKNDLGSLEEYAQKQTVSSKFVDKANVIIGAVQTIGTLFSIVCLIILGVKYMAGSVEEKAEYKKTLVPYFIGAVMVLGLSNLLKVIYMVISGLVTEI